MASSGIDPMPLPTGLRRDDIPAEACSSNRKTTLNDYPSPKLLIAGTDPLFLTRNDYKKRGFL